MKTAAAISRMLGWAPNLLVVMLLCHTEELPTKNSNAPIPIAQVVDSRISVQNKDMKGSNTLFS
jgi:hypothetical protein